MTVLQNALDLSLRIGVEKCKKKKKKKKEKNKVSRAGITRAIVSGTRFNVSPKRQNGKQEKNNLKSLYVTV